MALAGSVPSRYGCSTDRREPRVGELGLILTGDFAWIERAHRADNLQGRSGRLQSFLTHAKFGLIMDGLGERHKTTPTSW